LPNKWYENAGNEFPEAISTRIRLARNIDGYPFPSNLDEKARAQIIDLCKTAADSPGGYFLYKDISSADKREKAALREQYLISAEFENASGSRGLLYSDDQSVSLMINEEDHLRIQALRPGLDLFECFDKADRLDDLFDEKLLKPYAFSETFGYLTHCPTNLGTGMRSSVMLHLEALNRTGSMSSIISQVSKLGMTVRGAYGEGTKAQSNLFQVSNQLSLGLSENEILNKLDETVRQIINLERAAQKRLFDHDPDSYVDRIYRAAGTLKSAYTMSGDEAQILICSIMPAFNLNIDLRGLSKETLFSLLMETKVASTKGENPRERDKNRAALIRERLNV